MCPSDLCLMFGCGIPGFVPSSTCREAAIDLPTATDTRPPARSTLPAEDSQAAVVMPRTRATAATMAAARAMQAQAAEAAALVSAAPYRLLLAHPRQRQAPAPKPELPAAARRL